MEEKVTKNDLALMMVVAALFDLAQFGIAIALGWLAGVGFLAGPLISLFAIPSYFIWFSIKGMMDMRMGIKLALVSLGEETPGLDVAPLWSLFIGKIMLDEGKKTLGPLAKAIPTK